MKNEGVIWGIDILFAPWGQIVSYLSLYPPWAKVPWLPFIKCVVNGELITFGHWVSATKAGGTMCFMDTLQITVLITRNIEVQEKVSCTNSTYGGLGVKVIGKKPDQLFDVLSVATGHTQWAPPSIITALIQKNMLPVRMNELILALGRQTKQK